jgi:Fe-S-cluster containining protein
VYAGAVVTDLVQIRLLAAEKEGENLEFRRYLHDHPAQDERFHETAREIERQIDCTQCANCCCMTRVNVTDDEIDDIARHLRVTSTQVRQEYTEIDPIDHKRLLRQPSDTCVFLDNNLCIVYEARPRPCREFPYASTTKTTLGGRVSSIFRRAPICPIVYNAIEEHKRRVAFHPHDHKPPHTGE